MDSINLRLLRTHLCGSDKLPASFQGVFDDYTVFFRGGDFIRTTVCVGPSIPKPNGKKSSKHRVHLKCECGDVIPAGRFAQHNQVHEAAKLIDGLHAKSIMEFAKTRDEYKTRLAARLHKMFGCKLPALPTDLSLVKACRKFGLIAKR